MYNEMPGDSKKSGHANVYGTAGVFLRNTVYLRDAIMSIYLIISMLYTGIFIGCIPENNYGLSDHFGVFFSDNRLHFYTLFDFGPGDFTTVE
jgi:hypothetical protein